MAKLSKGKNEVPKPAFCPRCDRQYPSTKIMLGHLLKAHPDYDPASILEND